MKKNKLLLMTLNLAIAFNIAVAQPEVDAANIMSRAFITATTVNLESNDLFRVPQSSEEEATRNICKTLDSKFREYLWAEDPCGAVKWQAKLLTVRNNPLLFAIFGKGPETTLLLSGVHPNELTPIPMGFWLAKYLQNNPDIIKPNQRVIIAPLINPDAFFMVKPERTNLRGIDLNRNFFTHDWYEKSHSMWENIRKKNLNYFPGYFPNSEIETIFQVRLIEEFRPDKILSIHAPLGFLDYDGPGDQKSKPLSSVEEKARKLAQVIATKSKNYRIVDYSFYPGSLGNFAGKERQIPTVTLELKTSNPRFAKEYWEQFLPGMIQAINYPFRKNITEIERPSGFYSSHDDLLLRNKDNS